MYYKVKENEDKRKQEGSNMKNFAIFIDTDDRGREFIGIENFESEREAYDYSHECIDCQCDLDPCNSCDEDETDACDNCCLIDEEECTCDSWAIEIAMDVVKYDEDKEKYYTQKQWDYEEIWKYLDAALAAQRVITNTKVTIDQARNIIKTEEAKEQRAMDRFYVEVAIYNKKYEVQS